MSKHLMEENDMISLNIHSVCVSSVLDLSDEEIIAKEKVLSTVDAELRRFGDNVIKLMQQMPN